MKPTMRGALHHPNVQKIVAYQAAMARQDFAEGQKIFAPDVVYTVPGANPMSGRYVGPEAVMGYFGRLMQVTQGTYTIIDMLWLAGGEQVTLVTTNHATIGSRTLTWEEAIVFTFEDGRKKQIALFQAEQADVDALFTLA